MVSNAKIFVTLFLAVFATTIGVGIVIPLLPVYAHELGAGAFQIGLVFGAFSLSRSIFVPYFGKLSDRKGKKPFLTLGLFIYCLLSLLFLFSTNVQALILIRLGQGFASLTEPTKEFEKMCVGGELEHFGNPVLRWMLGNVEIDMDPAGSIKCHKGRSKGKIDGVAALINAVGEWMTLKNEKEPNVYIDVW